MLRAQLYAEAPNLLAVTAPPRIENRERYLTQRLSVDSAAMGSPGILRIRFYRPLRILMAMAGLLLLIASVNLANLLLARSLSRRREMAILVALGAGRWALIQRMLAESILLCSAGIVGGLVIAVLVTPQLAQRAWAGLSPVDLNLSPDPRVLVFIAGLSVFTIGAIGISTAFYTMRSEPARALQFGRSVDIQSAAWSRLFLVVQIGLSLVLIVVAGLFGQSLSSLRSRQFGFPEKEVLNVLVMPQPGQNAPINWSSYASELESHLKQVPGVRAAALSNGVLMDGSFAVPVSSFNSALTATAEVTTVTHGFFDALNLGVRDGRTFDDRDAATALRVAVISESLAQRLFPNASSVGRIVNAGPEPTRQGLTVIGVVADALLHDVHRDDRADIYLPASQQADSIFALGCLIVRADIAPPGLAANVQRVVQSLGRQYVFVSQTTEQRIRRLLIAEEMLSLLANSLGTMVLVLVAVGLFGLTAYSVSRRTSEIAIRLALGATETNIFRLFFGQTIKLLIAGLTVGLVAALASGRLVSSVVFGVSPRDPATFIASMLVILSVAIAATYIPIRRVVGADPAGTLKCER
jgi:predicted permease